MSTHSDHTSTASLFGQTRGALLALVYGHADQSFYLRQLIREVNSGHGALQRELKHLTELGLLVRKIQGNQVLYQANWESPIFPEIRSLIAKTAGAHDLIHSALASFGRRIKVAFIYGSVARQTERAGSDVDLMIIGDVPFARLIAAFGPVQNKLRREINPTVYPSAEFRTKLQSGNHFLANVMREKKIFVMGTEDDLRELAAT